MDILSLLDALQIDETFIIYNIAPKYRSFYWDKNVRIEHIFNEYHDSAGKKYIYGKVTEKDDASQKLTFKILHSLDGHYEDHLAMLPYSELHNINKFEEVVIYPEEELMQMIKLDKIK